jgi:hypothetical protein
MKSHTASGTLTVGKETTMTRHTRLVLSLLPAAALLAAGCEPPEQGSIFIQGARVAKPPECTVQAAAQGPFRSLSLLDIGTTPETANDLVLPVQVVTNLPATFSTSDVSQDRTRSPNYTNYGAADNNVITFTSAEAFLTTDADRDGEPALSEEGLPTSDSNARVTSVGGTVFNTQTSLNSMQILFINAITAEDAALLQQDKFVSEALGGDPTKTVQVNVTIRVEGVTTGNAAVRSPPFPYQVQLCQGCLSTFVTDCDAATAGDQPAVPAEVCNPGQDDPLFTCEGVTGP